MEKPKGLNNFAQKLRNLSPIRIVSLQRFMLHLVGKSLELQRMQRYSKVFYEIPQLFSSMTIFILKSSCFFVHCHIA
jgi:hypothetical protein